MTAADLFRRMVTRLEEAGIPNMLTGSFASAYHGRPRAPQDIGFVIAPSPDQIRALIRSLQPREYYAPMRRPRSRPIDRNRSST